MEPLVISPEEKKTEEKVKQYLRSQGYLPPISEADILAFEKSNPHEPLPPEANDPMAVLARGYRKPVKLQPRVEDNEISAEFGRLAARHGDKLTPDILKQLDEDEARDGGELSLIHI